MEHEFPDGFKPINIESYDGTTDPAVWIEDFLLHIHLARGDDLHAVKYLPLKLKGPARYWLNSLPETEHNSRNNNERLCDTAVNTEFHNPKPGQRKKPFKANQDGPSTLDRILDRPCQIHGHPDKPANHTNRNYWVLKQAGKLNAEHKGRRPPSDKDDGAARQPNTRGQKQFPFKVRSLPKRK
jgi:hypothetical protein